MTREQLIEFANFLDEGCDLLGKGYIESKTDEWLQKVANKNIVLSDVISQVCDKCGEKLTKISETEYFCGNFICSKL